MSDLCANRVRAICLHNCISRSNRFPVLLAGAQSVTTEQNKIFPSRCHQATIHEATCTVIDQVSPRVQDLRIQNPNHGSAASKYNIYIFMNNYVDKLTLILLNSTE